VRPPPLPPPDACLPAFLCVPLIHSGIRCTNSPSSSSQQIQRRDLAEYLYESTQRGGGFKHKWTLQSIHGDATITLEVLQAYRGFDLRVNDVSFADLVQDMSLDSPKGADRGEELDLCLDHIQPISRLVEFSRDRLDLMADEAYVPRPSAATASMFMLPHCHTVGHSEPAMLSSPSPLPYQGWPPRSLSVPNLLAGSSGPCMPHTTPQGIPMAYDHATGTSHPLFHHTPLPPPAECGGGFPSIGSFDSTGGVISLERRVALLEHTVQRLRDEATGTTTTGGRDESVSPVSDEVHRLRAELAHMREQHEGLTQQYAQLQRDHAALLTEHEWLKTKHANYIRAIPLIDKAAEAPTPPPIPPSHGGHTPRDVGIAGRKASAFAARRGSRAAEAAVGQDEAHPTPARRERHTRERRHRTVSPTCRSSLSRAKATYSFGARGGIGYGGVGKGAHQDEEQQRLLQVKEDDDASGLY